ncbi:hypothetical protein [Streptococcus suis]
MVDGKAILGLFTFETQNPTFVAAYETAIANWNATGAFTFVTTSDPN